MSREILKIDIEPSILKYARYCSGFNIGEAAKKMGIKEEVLISLEESRGEVSLSKLKKIAEVYKMPLVYFLLEEAPKDKIVPKDFRRVYSQEKDGFSPSLMLAIRRARYVQSTIQELRTNKVNYNFQHISISDDIEKIASGFRSLLKVSTDDQYKWSDPAEALKNWKRAIEALGIFVLQQSLPEKEVSAFSLADNSPYIIMLNSIEHENRRIFSLFHEVCHILLNNSGICTPDNLSKNSFDYKKIEIFCNRFSASLLIPRNEFVDDMLVQKLKNTPFDEWIDSDVINLSKRFRVSSEVIYRRLSVLGIITEEQYEEKRNILMKKFEEYKKNKKRGSMAIPQYIKILSKNGRAYSSFILENLHSNRITFADAANYLDTNSRHISKVEMHI